LKLCLFGFSKKSPSQRVKPTVAKNVLLSFAALGGEKYSGVEQSRF